MERACVINKDWKRWAVGLFSIADHKCTENVRDAGCLLLEKIRYPGVKLPLLSSVSFVSPAL